MRAPPLSEDDSLGKAALFTKYIQALPHALDSWKETGLGLVTNLLSGIQKAVQVNTPVHQNMFRYSNAMSKLTSASVSMPAMLQCHAGNSTGCDRCFISSRPLCKGATLLYRPA